MNKRFDVPLRLYIFIAALFIMTPVKAAAQNLDEFAELDLSGTNFSAGLSVGFNYDLLRSPTSVSFDYPVGFFGFNVPFGLVQGVRSVGGDEVDDFFNDEELFRNGEGFNPKAGAGQNANYTVRVDMPMLYGVGSFAYTQNFFMNYHTTLGNAALNIFTPDSVKDNLREENIDFNFFMRGGVSIPLQLSLGWETVTFGYAYKLNRHVVFALNLHRHLFSMNFRGRADVDLLGTIDATVAPKVDEDEFGLLAGLGEISISHLLDFPSEMINGSVNGRFTASAWTPSIGVKLGRVSLASRFGLNTKAKGSIHGQFRMPDIVNVETGELDIDVDNLDAEEAIDLIDRLTDISVDSIVYKSTESMHWKLPQGHTISLEVIRDVFSLSYTKTYGDIEMRLKNIHRTSTPSDAYGQKQSDGDTINVDLGVTVDHIIMANFSLFRAVFLNVGVFAFDVRSEDNENIVGDAVPSQMRMGKAAMFPVLSLGGTMGSKIKLHIEADVLPLPAVKTGIFYYF